MRYSKLQNELRLILLLADSVGYTAIELSKKMNISRRQIYYLLDFIKSAGFILFKQDNKYHIDRRSSFLPNCRKLFSLPILKYAPYIICCS